MKRLILAVLTVLAVLTLAACVPSATSLPAEAGAAYAAEVDDIVESFLVGLSENDYTMQSRDFSEALLEAVDESTFQGHYDEFIGVVGAYQSKTLDHVEQHGQVRIVIYLAVFKNDPDVAIGVGFNPDHLIAHWGWYQEAP